VPVSKPPTPEAPVQKKQKKLSEPGDLGGTNGTHTISEAPPQNEKKSEQGDCSSSSSEGEIPQGVVEKP